MAGNGRVQPSSKPGVAKVFQRLVYDYILDSIENEADVVCVGCTGRMRIDLFLEIFILC